MSKQKQSGGVVDRRIADDLESRAKEGSISCAEAFFAADGLSVKPEEIGAVMDSLTLAIVNCQLGLFGYGEKKKIVRPAGYVPADTEKLIRDSLADGKIPCAAVWAVARRTGRSRFDVSCACEALGIKVSHCQLGAF